MGLSNADLFRTIVKKQKRIGDAFPVSTNSRMFAYIISSAMDVSFRALDGLEHNAEDYIERKENLGIARPQLLTNNHHFLRRCPRRQQKPKNSLFQFVEKNSSTY